MGNILSNYFLSSIPHNLINHNHEIEKASYIFMDDEKIHRFMYFKLSKKQLQEALPISYQDNTSKNYLTVVFDEDGRDFLGQATYDEILELINKYQMTNLLEGSFDKIKNDFNLGSQELQNMIDFARNQLHGI